MLPLLPPLSRVGPKGSIDHVTALKAIWWQAGQLPQSLAIVDSAASSRRFGVRNEGNGSHLGRVRWVVKRTIAWVKGLGRVRVRYDKSADVIDAWASLAAAAIRFGMLRDDPPTVTQLLVGL